MSSSKSFVAGFDSVCPECGCEIAGNLDVIVMNDGDAIHEDCDPEPEPQLPTFPI